LADLLDLQSAQTIKIVGVDATGVETNPVDADANRNMKVTLIQQEFISTGNSTSSNLASLAVFTGTSESVLGYSLISVTFKADQSCTIQVQQSTDGTNWDISDSYTVPASSGDHRSFALAATYIRVVVTNNGGSATTFLRLQTIISPVGEPSSTSSINVSVGVVDKTTFTYGTDKDQPIGAVYQDTAPTVSAGQQGAVRMTQYRGLHTNLRDSSGAESGVVANPLHVSVRQHEVISTNNSSVANLASSATFTGTAEDGLGYQLIGVTFKATQNCTIQIQQSGDGTNWDVSDSYTVAANTGDSRVFHFIARYVRVLVTNNGGISTTNLRLQTIITPIGSILPRYLTQFGNLPIEIKGGTDGTGIGNNGDKLKVDAYQATSPWVTSDVNLSNQLGNGNILRQSEISVTTKIESDLPSSTYTVPAGKSFRLSTFGGSFDIMSPMYVRLKKQTGGTGSFVTFLRFTLKIHGQDESDFQMVFPHGLNIGSAGDVFKITYESALAKGTFWGGFVGVEY
jgi:hypothetical protein